MLLSHFERYERSVRGARLRSYSPFWGVFRTFKKNRIVKNAITAQEQSIVTSADVDMITPP